jgi:hypothetical protein
MVIFNSTCVLSLLFDHQKALTSPIFHVMLLGSLYDRTNLCGITAKGLFTYLNKNGTCMKRQKPNKSMHFVGGVEVENVTTASGVLGLKGRHPEAEDKENENLNQRRRPKKARVPSRAV